jgi:hypothetical protein
MNFEVEKGAKNLYGASLCVIVSNYYRASTNSIVSTGT